VLVDCRRYVEERRKKREFPVQDRVMVAACVVRDVTVEDVRQDERRWASAYVTESSILACALQIPSPRRQFEVNEGGCEQ
jgi:hypothetical protein